MAQLVHIVAVKGHVSAAGEVLEPGALGAPSPPERHGGQLMKEVRDRLKVWVREELASRRAVEVIPRGRPWVRQSWHAGPLCGASTMLARAHRGRRSGRPQAWQQSADRRGGGTNCMWLMDVMTTRQWPKAPARRRLSDHARRCRPSGNETAPRVLTDRVSRDQIEARPGGEPDARCEAGQQCRSGLAADQGAGRGSSLIGCDPYGRRRA